MYTLNNIISKLSIVAAVAFSADAFAGDSESYGYEADSVVYDSPINRVWKAHKPWRAPQDTTTAINDPDLYAWQLFVALNWPADENKCRPDRKANLGDEGRRLVWETWQSREETFLEGAVKPESWRQGCDVYETLPSGDFTVFADENVRMNKLAYNFIRDNKLYSMDEQERLAQQGIRDIDFPLGSKTTKAHWVRIEEADKPRYHWVETVRDGEVELYGLTGLHIVSKDHPEWFWSTFEHVDNETRWPFVYPTAFQGWKTPAVDSVACPADQLDCNRIPEGFGLEGTKWENYRLRGTQVNWVDNRGTPTVLANTQLEAFMDLGTSSCLTCHALQVVGTSGGPRPLPFLKDERNAEGHRFGFVGPLDPEIFLDENGVEVPYIGLDYVWTLRNAKREN